MSRVLKEIVRDHPRIESARAIAFVAKFTSRSKFMPAIPAKTFALSLTEFVIGQRGNC